MEEQVNFKYNLENIFMHLFCKDAETWLNYPR